MATNRQQYKTWFTSRTVWFNGLTILGGVALAFADYLASGVTITAIGLLNVILRFMTNAQLE